MVAHLVAWAIKVLLDFFKKSRDSKGQGPWSPSAEGEIFSTYYPLIDPIMMPFSKNRCTIGYRISSGAADTTIIAYFKAA